MSNTDMAFVRPLLGRLLFNLYQNYEFRVIDHAIKNNVEPKFHGLSSGVGRHLLFTAEARAENGQPKELRMWFKYSRFYLYLIWYKLSKLFKKVDNWLNRPFLG